MDSMAQAIAAALKVLNPAGAKLDPGTDATGAQRPAPRRDNCDKPADNRDTIPPAAT